MEIRYVTDSDDRYDISRIYEDSWKYAYKGIVPDSYLENIPKGRWSHIADIPERRSVILIDDGCLIGTSSFGKSRSNDLPAAGEIVSLYLRPEYIGTGCGKALLEFAAGELAKDGYDDIFLWVLEENKRARKFYERNGFIYDNASVTVNIGGKDLKELRLIRRARLTSFPEYGII